HTRSKRDWSSDVCSSDLDLSLVQIEHIGEKRIVDTELGAAHMLSGITQPRINLRVQPALRGLEILLCRLDALATGLNRGIVRQCLLDQTVQCPGMKEMVPVGAH